jgi:hypothetical protein
MSDQAAVQTLAVRYGRDLRNPVRSVARPP